MTVCTLDFPTSSKIVVGTHWNGNSSMARGIIREFYWLLNILLVLSYAGKMRVFLRKR